MGATGARTVGGTWLWGGAGVGDSLYRWPPAYDMCRGERGGNDEGTRGREILEKITGHLRVLIG